MPRDGARAKPDRRGCVRIDSDPYRAGPVWHDRGLVVGVRARTAEALAGRGRHVATLGRSFREGERVRNPVSLAPAPIARPRAFGESTIRADMPDGLVDAIDQLDKAGRRQALRVLAKTAETSGFKAACEAEEHILEGGRIPDEASADMLARRIAAGRLEGGSGPDLAAYDDLPARGAAWVAASDAMAERIVAAGRRCPPARAAPQGWASKGTPRQVEYLAGYLEAECQSRDAPRRASLLGRCALPQLKTFDGHGWDQTGWPGGFDRDDLVSLFFLGDHEDLVPMGGVGAGRTHMAEALCALCCQDARPARFLAASSLVMRPGRARDDARPGRELAQIGRADPLAMGELGFLPPGVDGARLLFQVISQAYEAQSVVLTTNPGSSRWGAVLGDDQMAAAVIDRVVHHGRLLQFKGEPYRVRHSLMQ